MKSGLWMLLIAASAVAQSPDLELLPRSQALLPSGVPWDFGPYYDALGTRLHGNRTARVTITGSLRDSRGAGSVQLQWQLPGYARIDDARPGGRVLLYDGAVLTAPGGPPTPADLPLLESLVVDLPENVFAQLAEGGAFRRILHWARVEAAGAPDSGVRVDVFQVYPSRGIASRASTPVEHKLVVFDSKTRLLHSVRYQRLLNQRPVTVETRYLGWTQTQGQPHPREIVRHEDGVEVLRLDIAAFTVGPRAPRSSFRP